MSKDFLTPEEGEELKMLYAAIPSVATKLGEALRKHGMSSEEFRIADREYGNIMVRIRDIRGMKDWMG